MTDFQYVLADITHIITCLYAMSIAIREPSPRDRLYKYPGIKVSHYEPDELRVQDMFPGAPEYLTRRLVKANLRRRQLLQINQGHHNKILGRIDDAELQHRQRTLAISELETTASQYESPSILIEARADCEAALPPTTVVSSAWNSHTTLSTFVERTDTKIRPEDNFETESEAEQSQTSYASSSGGTSHLYIPPLPSALNGRPSECPYCFLTIKPKDTPSWM